MDRFMPHGMCYLWQPELVWLHVVSDGIIAVAYLAIPPALLWLVVSTRRDMSLPGSGESARFQWVVGGFGVFIVACGLTHVMGIWTVWEPRYWLSGGVKVVTAAASLVIAVALPPLVPRFRRVLRDARDSVERRERVKTMVCTPA